jgi:uncharacterized membrane protein YoaT (DUF817 family)
MPMLRGCSELEIVLIAENVTVYSGKFRYQNNQDRVGEFVPMSRAAGW